MKRGVLLVGALLLAALAAVPLHNVLSPVIFAGTLAIGLSVLFGARELAGKLLTGVIILLALATAWPGLVVQVRQAVDSSLEAPGLSGFSIPAGVVYTLLAFFGIVVLAAVVLFVAKLRRLLPAPAASSRPITLSRAQITEPNFSTNPSSSSAPTGPRPSSSAYDDLDLFGGGGHVSG